MAQPVQACDDQAADIDDPGHLFRLFVGWVPKDYTEAQLRPIFEQHSAVRDIHILRDQRLGTPRGCAFVSFATKAEAELIIQKLDRQVHLPGALCPLEVRFAKSHQYIQAGSGPVDNRQLFFSSAPATYSEEDISALFSAYGVVEEVNLFRERKSGNSKGCGFVTMQTREQAIEALHTLEPEPGLEASSSGQQMQVKWADPDLQVKKKKALEDSNADNRMLFFAKVLRSANEQEVKALFSKFGKVYDVNLFRAFQGAPTTKGCGLVTMGTHEDAVTAIDALDNKFSWDGMESPMVVKWMDAALQRRRREQHLAALRQGLVPNTGLGAADPWMPASLALSGMSQAARINLGPTFLGQEPQEATETPPPGCNPDAIKLFVGNIPKSCTEEQLQPFFETIGKVVELVIVRDKANHESKGSAFVWYATRAQAERAILQFNLRHVLPDPSGDQDRPLVVRKAKARSRGGIHPAVSMLAQSTALTLGSNPAAYYTQGPKLQQGLTLGRGLEGLQQTSLSAVGAIPMASAQGHGYSSLTSAIPLRSVQPLAGVQLVSIQNAPAVQDGLYEAYSSMGATSADHMDPYLATTSGHLHDLNQIALSIPMTQQQLSTVHNHLFSVQTMSGAQVHISPGAPGIFHLVISGVKAQVDGAKDLITHILSQGM